MIDIVERLRRLAERERPYGSLPDTLDEAAVEIERLRSALQDIIADSFSVYAIQVARAVLGAQPTQTQEEA